ncbi:hypothetical protein KBA39_08670 [Myxococcota bacterium]|nr:hypothetical protein [Myxococcota bacterium]HOD07147.1 hypothetical protein [Myxococcota bacterium]
MIDGCAVPGRHIARGTEIVAGLRGATVDSGDRVEQADATRKTEIANRISFATRELEMGRGRA